VQDDADAMDGASRKRSAVSANFRLQLRVVGVDVGGREDSNPRPSPWQVDTGENWRMPATDSAGKHWLVYVSEPTQTAAPAR
jgi:hypothetical protein